MKPAEVAKPKKKPPARKAVAIPSMVLSKPDWACTACTFENLEHVLACNMCGTQKRRAPSLFNNALSLARARSLFCIALLCSLVCQFLPPLYFESFFLLVMHAFSIVVFELLCPSFLPTAVSPTPVDSNLGRVLAAIEEQNVNYQQQNSQNIQANQGKYEKPAKPMSKHLPPPLPSMDVDFNALCVDENNARY